MDTEPRLPLGFPLSAQLMRDSIGKSKGDEIHSALLLPMWQAIRGETNVSVRIEKVQFGH
jgi:hypothetical protein